MPIRAYLPSAQFSAVAAALVVSVALVWGAAAITGEKTSSGKLAASEGGAPAGGAVDWRSQFPSESAFETSQTIAEAAQDLTEKSKTGNVTDSIGRSLLIGASAAQGQGIAGSLGTESTLITSALSQINNSASLSAPYTASQFTVVSDTPEALRAFGNGLALAIGEHPEANYASVMIAVGIAIDHSDPENIPPLLEAARAYRSLADAVSRVPVPRSLATQALSTANNYAQMAGACENMGKVLTDPILGLAGIQQFDALTSQNTLVFTRIAEHFQKNAILFGKNEAGAAWAKFLALAKEAQAQSQ